MGTGETRFGGGVSCNRGWLQINDPMLEAGGMKDEKKGEWMNTPKLGQ